MQIKKTTLAVLLIIFIPFIIGISSATGYNVSGYAFNSSGFVLAGVLVKAINTENTAVTDSSGYYIIFGLPSNIYTFSYNKTGYDTGYNNITVNGEDIINANITLNNSITLTPTPTPTPSPTPATEFIPPPPVLVNPDGAAKPGSFWINYTWKAGEGYVTDSYNVSVNGTWTNGTTDTFINTTTIPHGWVNISVAGYNATSQLLSEFISRNTQIPNNPITLMNVSGIYSLNVGDTLYIKAEYTDADNDTGNFSTTATKGTFNTSTGILTWTPAAGEGGVYNWQISVTDGYGSISTQQIKVIVRLNYNVKFIEPGVINNNGTWVETWGEARAGHVGKLIGIDGSFNNTGEDSLTLTITDSPSIYCRDKPCTVELSKGQGMSFMQAFSERWAFELNSTEVNWIDQTHGFFNYTLKISVTGHNGSTPTFNYDNTTTISLPLYPIYKIKRSSGDIAAVIAGGTTTITYTLEANSSVNLTNISIYDSFYPQEYFNISKLEADMPQNISYTYPATTDDLSKFKCEGGYQCIINMATLTGRTESGELINDTDFVRIFQVQLKPASIGSSGSGSGGGGGGGGGGSPASSEDFNNIERREVREMDIFTRSASNYVFKDADPVMVVAFESSTSENGVPVAVEVLKNRSRYIGDDAPGKLYKYFNVFVGISRFSKKVSNRVIVFRVNNAWLEDNDLDPKDISLYKWNGEWAEKSTEIAEKKSNYTYFASYVGNFSSFAVARVKKPNNSLASSNPMAQNEPANNTNSTNQTLSNSNSNSSLGFSKGKLPGALAMLPALILLAGGGNWLLSEKKQKYKWK